MSFVPSVQGAVKEESIGGLSKPSFRSRRQQQQQTNIGKTGNNEWDAEEVPFGHGLAYALPKHESLHREIQLQLYDFWNLARPKQQSNQRLLTKFPAPQPLTCNREIFDSRVRDHILDWWVTYKSNGTRGMLLFTSMNHYTIRLPVYITRKCDMFLIPIDVPDAYYEGTLFDGDLVQIDATSIEPMRYEFQVSDCLFSCGTSIRHRYKSDRLLVRDWLLWGKDAIESVPNQTPFEVVSKPFLPLYRLPELMRIYNLYYLLGNTPTAQQCLQKLLLQQNGNNNNNQSMPVEELKKQLSVLLSTLPDGLILEEEAAYICEFTSQHILKLKPWEFCTLDFRFQVNGQDMRQVDLLMMTNLSKTQVQDKFFCSQPLYETFQPLSTSSIRTQEFTLQDAFMVLDLPIENGELVAERIQDHIFECVYDQKAKLWKPVKIRTNDKSWPNHEQVVKDTQRILQHPVHLQELLDLCTQVVPSVIDTKDQSDENSVFAHSHSESDVLLADQLLFASNNNSDLNDDKVNWKTRMTPEQRAICRYNYQQTRVARRQQFLRSQKAVPSFAFYSSVTGPDSEKTAISNPLGVDDGQYIFELLTSYERAKAIGVRALQLSLGAPSTIDIEHLNDTLQIASHELQQRKMPFMIRRPYPSGRFDIVSVNELALR